MRGLKRASPAERLPAAAGKQNFTSQRTRRSREANSRERNSSRGLTADFRVALPLRRKPEKILSKVGELIKKPFRAPGRIASGVFYLEVSLALVGVASPA